jgi:hypothetical protein
VNFENVDNENGTSMDVNADISFLEGEGGGVSFDGTRMHFLPYLDNDNTFASLRCDSESSAFSLCGAFFHKESGMAAFGEVPSSAAVGNKADDDARAKVGLRWNGTGGTIGGLLSGPSLFPESSNLTLWAAAASPGGIIAAAQCMLPTSRALTKSALSADFLLSHTSGDSDLSLALRGLSLGEEHHQIAESDHELSLTWLHHLAFQREVQNPLEKSNVVAITNCTYLQSNSF